MKGEKMPALCVLLLGAFVLAGSGCGMIRQWTMPVRTVVSDEVMSQAAATVFLEFSSKSAWTVEDWSDKAEMKVTGATPSEQEIVLAMEPGKTGKCAFSRRVKSGRELAKYNAIIIDVTSELEADCLVSIALRAVQRRGGFVETPAAVVKRGLNRNLVFRLDKANCKNEISGWKYTVRIGDLSRVSQIFLLVSSKEAGVVRIDNLRLAKFPG